MKRESYMSLSILASLLIAARVIVAAPSQQAGICYGTVGDNLPSPEQAVSLMEGCGIAKFRLYEPQPEILRQKSRLVSLTVRNQDLAGLAASPDAAKEWVNQNVVPYSNILEIVVGNEVVPSQEAQWVPNAMRNIQAALGPLDDSVVVTTSIYGAALANGYPPSQTVFTPETIGVMTEIVQFLGSNPPWKQKLYVSVYPYYAAARDPAHVSLDYATFVPGAPAVMDGDLAYTNLFDAMFDGYVWALEKIGGGDIDLTVGESGWPSAGDGDFTTPALASTYVTNLYNHMVNNNGSPKRPNGFGDFYVFALFNENLKPAGIEQNWGLFDPNMQHVYSTPLC